MSQQSVRPEFDSEPTTALARLASGRKESSMNLSNCDHRTAVAPDSVSRRVALRGLGGAGLAALAFTIPAYVAADEGDRIANALFPPASRNDPATLITDYLAAVNAGDLEAILALYNDDAFHIALPSPDGSAGVCLGKEQFRMWYEQSVARGDRMQIEDGTLTVDGNQATYVARLSSEPWHKLGVDALEATSEIVVIDGRIMTHVVVLTPGSVQQ
jgi:ketosteroid isomerase-like protein